MPNIVDTSYFERGNLYIPNNKDITVEPVDSPSVVTNLEDFITNYERELLLNALGVTLYDELQEDLAKLPFVEDTEPPSLATADQKWIDLVNGKNYVNPNGVTKRWEGLKGYNKESLIAFFIFTEYLRDDNETYATVGTVKSKAKNAENTSATPKFIKAYNRFLKAYQGDCSGIAPRVVVNGFGSVGLDYFGAEEVQVSLLRYLTDSNELVEDTYPDFEFRTYEILTSLGI